MVANPGFLELTERTIRTTDKDGRLPPDAPDWIYEIDNPYLHGFYAPVMTEVQTDALSVRGQIPPDLHGAYVRNSPNPMFKPLNRYHPFDGDGMLSAIQFRDGAVCSYTSRWIKTASLQKEQAEGRAIWPGVMGPFDFSLPHFPIKDTANTDVVLFNRELLALWYMSGVPYAVDPFTLETKGPETFGGVLDRSISAHCRVDIHTGEMLFFHYGDEPPYMVYYVANAQGEITNQVPVDLPGPRSPHEIGITENYSILHDFPFFHDIDILRRHNKRVVTFHPDLPARYGIVPRHGGTDDIKWFECEPCYMLHSVNAWEEGDWIIMDGCRSIDPIPEANPENGELSHMLSYMVVEANLYRWRFNMKTGEVREGPVCDLNTEFPKPNPLFVGRKSKYAYIQRIPKAAEGGKTLTFTALMKYDCDTGEYQKWDYGEGVYGSEAAFAPRKGATLQDAEDDGYVTTYVTDTRTWQSECLIFDARDIRPGPLARIALPSRLGLGFHANWFRGEDLFQPDGRGLAAIDNDSASRCRWRR